MRRSRQRPLLIIAAVLAFANVAASQIVAPADFGKVTLDTYSTKAGFGPVVFDHWLHRSMYTCRVCHVDIGFGMKAKTSGIQARTNREGFHCGACHDGRKKHEGTPIFASCSGAPAFVLCDRARSLNLPFQALPRAKTRRFGHGNSP